MTNPLDPRTSQHPDPNLHRQRKYQDKRYKSSHRRLGIWLDTHGKAHLEALLKLNPCVTDCVHYALHVAVAHAGVHPTPRPTLELPDQSPAKNNKARWRQRVARWLTTSPP